MLPTDIIDFRRRITQLIIAECVETGAKQSRIEDLRNMINNGRWDKFRLVSTDAMVMKMIDAELMQEDDGAFSETISY